MVALLISDIAPITRACLVLNDLCCWTNLLSGSAHATSDVVGDNAAQRNLAVRAGKARRSSLGTFVRVGWAEVAVGPSISLGTRVALSGGRRACDAIGRFADGTGGAHTCEDKDKDKRREKREKREERRQKRTS